MNSSVFELLRKEILNVTYFCRIDPETVAQLPEMVDWYVLNFTEYQLILKMNITNMLYVSSGQLKD